MKTWRGWPEELLELRKINGWPSTVLFFDDNCFLSSDFFKQSKLFLSVTSAATKRWWLPNNSQDILSLAVGINFGGQKSVSQNIRTVLVYGQSNQPSNSLLINIRFKPGWIQILVGLRLVFTSAFSPIPNFFCVTELDNALKSKTW